MEKKKKWLLLRSVANEIEAEVLKGFLQSSGISCFINISDRGVYMPSGAAPIGKFEIYVEESFFEESKSLLKEYEKNGEQ